MSDIDNFLEHYGVIGMKWGVRKDRKGRRGKKERKTSTEGKRAKEILKKAKKTGVSSLTNKELGDLNKRLNLEQNFSQLTSKPSKFKKGTGFVKEALNIGNMGNQAYSLAKSPAADLIKEFLKKKKQTKK